MTRARRARDRDRPRLAVVERTLLDRVMQVVGIVALLVGAWLLAAEWSGLPESVPVHFDLSGRPDAWGPRSTLILLYLLALASYVALGLAERAPHTFSYPVTITEENAPRQYALGIELLAVTKVWLALLLLHMLRVIVALASGEGMDRPALPMLLLGGAYAGFLILYLARSRRTG